MVKLAFRKHATKISLLALEMFSKTMEMEVNLKIMTQREGSSVSFGDA
jgi:hypothetical protein